MYDASLIHPTRAGEAVEFDADGNMLSGGLNQFDSRNRLVQAGEVVYSYDAENQRVGVNQTQYVINSQPALSQVLVKTEVNGTQTYYVYGLGLIGQESNGEYLSYHFDFRGSTVALTDENKQVVERFQYSPYGTLLSGDVSTTPFLFNGMYGVMTDESGLYYMRARFYSPEIRRFVNQDVLLGDIFEGQTLNRYAFVTGQPVNFVDPFGLSVYWCDRQINIDWIPEWVRPLLRHHWIKTDKHESGMGGECPIPGQDCADVPYDPVKTKDHSGQSSEPGASCTLMHNVDEECVNDLIKPKQDIGEWTPYNQCQSFAGYVMSKCRYGPQE